MCRNTTFIVLRLKVRLFSYYEYCRIVVCIVIRLVSCYYFNRVTTNICIPVHIFTLKEMQDLHNGWVRYVLDVIYNQSTCAQLVNLLGERVVKRMCAVLHQDESVYDQYCVNTVLQRMLRKYPVVSKPSLKLLKVHPRRTRRRPVDNEGEDEEWLRFGLTDNS